MTSELNKVTLAAAVDIVIPVDEWPGGWDGGTADLLAHEPDLVASMLEAIGPVAATLDDEARELAGVGFAELDLERRQAVFDVVAKNPDLAVPVAMLVQLAMQGFYASARHGEPAGLAMIGFRGVPHEVQTVEPEPWPTVEHNQLNPFYDVVIVGAGAGGGVAAGVLAEGGARVLLLERAPAHTNAELRGDHFRGKRVGLTQVTASPGPGHPRVIVQPDGSVLEAQSFEHATWGLNAMAVGGGTRVWQGMAWRFMPEDFAMASTYGAPEGSTLADWPFGYEELAPYYERAEWEIGVAGEEGPLTARTPRSRPYPMPPLPGGRFREVYGAAADRLGWNWGPIPFALNSVPRFGRASCVGCPQCVGHACPVDAKNGTHNTLVRRALATGSCDLAVKAQVVEILTDGRARADGVRIVFDTVGGPIEKVVSCDRVVVSAGAVETPRLLHVSGLGNSWVGRNLHDHSGGLAMGLCPDPIQHPNGPGHNIATLDFVHRNGEAWGGGVIFDALPMLPVSVTQLSPMFGVAVGGVGTQAMDARRTASPPWCDEHRAGYSVGAIQCQRGSQTCVTASVCPWPDSKETSIRRRARSKRTWRSDARSGSTRSVVHRRGPSIRPDWMTKPAAGEHSAGTCRMGHDPAQSACDSVRSSARHGERLRRRCFAAPDERQRQPGTHVMANAFRVAELLLEENSQ